MEAWSATKIRAGGDSEIGREDEEVFWYGDVCWFEDGIWMKSGVVFYIEIGLPRSWGGARLDPNWCVAHVAQGPLRELKAWHGAATPTTYNVRPPLPTSNSITLKIQARIGSKIQTQRGTTLYLSQVFKNWFSFCFCYSALSSSQKKKRILTWNAFLILFFFFNLYIISNLSILEVYWQLYL